MKKTVSKSKTSSPKAKSSASGAPASQRPITLAVDIGGTGIKMMELNSTGKPITERLRALTPEQPTPTRVLAVLDELRSQFPSDAPDFDRVSVGFPGVVKRGVTMIAVNLHPDWANFPLQATLHKHWNKPVIVANDASVQGYGAIYGKGVELCLTLGTGLGSSLFTEGHLCPGLELAHHPWRKDREYEDYLGLRGLKKYGKKRWNKLVQKAIAQTSQLFNWDYLHIGGGNAKHINFELGNNMRIVPNEEGLLGGVALWRNQ